MSEEKNEAALISYAKNKGLSVISDESPYNDTDSAVFSVLAYLNFEDIEVIDGKNTLSDYINEYKESKNGQNALSKEIGSSARNKIELAIAIAENPRYKDLEIKNIQEHHSDTKPEQFAAMTIAISDDEQIAVFRGTDANVTSWWEDLTWGYNKKGTESVAQEMAKNYLNNMKDVEKIHVTGHSKGGGLSEWSAIFCDESIRKHIVSIKSLDGPGFRKDIKNDPEVRKIYDQLREQLGENWYTIVPTESVVGYIMADAEQIKVVGSSAGTLDKPWEVVNQHDIFTWDFKDGALDCSEINSRETGGFSKFMNGLLDDSMAMIPRGILEKASDPAFKLAAGVLDDEILDYFSDLMESYSRSSIEGDIKLGQVMYNYVSTVFSIKWSLNSVKESLKWNLRKTALYFTLDEIKELKEYVDKSSDYYKNIIGGAMDKLGDKVESVWDYINFNNVESALQEAESKRNAVIMNSCMINGLRMIDNSLNYMIYKYNSGANLETIGRNFLKGLNSMINDMLSVASPWKNILSMFGLDNTKSGNKFIKSINKLGINLSTYINEILSIGLSTAACDFKPVSVSVCQGNGQIGLEFSLLPQIDCVIESVVLNHNTAIKMYLDKISKKLGKLEYTSFAIERNIEMCRESLENQKRSLYDFRDSLKEYNSNVRNMESEIIRKLNTIVVDC